MLDGLSLSLGTVLSLPLRVGFGQNFSEEVRERAVS